MVQLTLPLIKKSIKKTIKKCSKIPQNQENFNEIGSGNTVVAHYSIEININKIKICQTIKKNAKLPNIMKISMKLVLATLLLLISHYSIEKNDASLVH